ncbi:MAG TPA: choice-of-anchor A family protein, partial [Saprospiraceae bacterium]|nr:choice-of-anchor A family protein [Saprospiraceae bacterium]
MKKLSTQASQLCESKISSCFNQKSISNHFKTFRNECKSFSFFLSNDLMEPFKKSLFRISLFVFILSFPAFLLAGVFKPVFDVFQNSDQVKAVTITDSGWRQIHTDLRTEKIKAKDIIVSKSSKKVTHQDFTLFDLLQSSLLYNYAMPEEFNNPSGSNPLSPAGIFNIFVKESVELKSGDSDGPVALGGNLTLNGSFNSSMHTAGNFTASGDNRPSALIINGRVFYGSGSGVNVNQNGYVKIGNLTGSNIYNNLGNTRIAGGGQDSNPRINLQTQQPISSVGPVSNLINFNTAFNTLVNNSESLSSYTNNITIGANGHLTLAANTVNVLNITGSTLASYNAFTFNNQPSQSSPLIINVNTGSSYSWNIPNLAGIGDQHGKYILWNFYNTSTLTFNGGGTLKGTVLAPKAHFIKNNSGNIDGQVVAKQYTHNVGEVHNYPFDVTLTQSTACPTEAATSTGHSVKFLGVTYQKGSSGCTSTWSYEVRSNPGTNAISHVTFGGQSCLVCLSNSSHIVSASPGNFVVGNDPTTNYCGIKFDNGFSSGQTKILTFTMNGAYKIGEITFVAKAGPGFTTAQVCGPVCEPPSCEDDDVCTTNSFNTITCQCESLPANLSLSLTPNKQICEGESVELIASASGGVTPYTYQWDQGLGNGPIKTVTPLVNTTYKVTATDAAGCKVTGSVEVKVFKLNNPGEIGYDEERCEGYTPNKIVNISNAISNQHGTISYQWQVHNPTTNLWQNIFGATGLEYQPPFISHSRMYRRLAKVNNCTWEASNIVTKKVNPLPEVSCPEDLEVCIDASPFALTGATPTGGEYSGTGVNNGTFNPSTAGAGLHTITYTYTDGKNCTNTCTFRIKVNPLPEVSCPSDQEVCIDAIPFALT